MMCAVAIVLAGGTYMDGLIGWVWLFGLGVAGTVCHRGVLISPSAPSVRRWDRLWSSAVKGEGDSVGVVLFTCVTLPPCGYCLEASMTARSTAPLDCGSSPQ